MVSPEVEKAVKLLKTAALSNEDRQLLTSAMLVSLGALPIRARITVDETGAVLIDGRGMSLLKANQLRKSARSLLKNFARNFVQDTIKFMAVKQAVHENTNQEQTLFAKAILYQHQEEHILYELLAGYAGGE